MVTSSYDTEQLMKILQFTSQKWHQKESILKRSTLPFQEVLPSTASTILRRIPGILLTTTDVHILELELTLAVYVYPAPRQHPRMAHNIFDVIGRPFSLAVRIRQSIMLLCCSLL
jgi:hypothetical protein